jgi:hypothetical protein
MSHQDSGWRPTGAGHTYNGFEVYDHGIWATETNVARVDGDVSFDRDDGETAYFLPEFLAEE